MNSIFAKISSRENISNSLFAKFSSRENKVLHCIQYLARCRIEWTKEIRVTLLQKMHGLPEIYTCPSRSRWHHDVVMRSPLYVDDSMQDR